MKNALIITLLSVFPTALFADLPDIAVARADRQTVRLPAGTSKGLKTGMWLEVFRQEEPIIHPVTGEALGAPRVKIAEVQVTKAFRTTAVGKITMSYAPIAAGDIVREAGAVPMEPSATPASRPSAERQTMSRGSDDTQKSAERLTWEINEIRANIASLSRALGRIAGIERTVARMEGSLGSMQSSVSALKHEMESLKEKSTAPQVVSVSHDNLAEFKVKHANINVAVRSGAEPLLIPVEAFAQIILPYVKEGQAAAVDSLVRAKMGEAKGAAPPAAAGHGAETAHAPAEGSHAAPSSGEDPMAELQRLMDESKTRPAWRVYLETYWPFGAGIGIFLGLVIVVVKLVRRRKHTTDDEDGILDLDEEMPAPEAMQAEEEEEEQK